MSFQFGNTISLIWKKLHRGDYTVKPFPAYKLWEMNSISGDSNRYDEHGIQVYKAVYPRNDLYYGGVINISSSLYNRNFTTQSLDPSMVWYYLDHTFFTDHKVDKQPTVLTDASRITNLAATSSVFIIPQRVFGEGIKRNTFSVSNFNAVPTYNYSIVDDGNGNLIDTTISTTDYVDDDKLLMYVGFNEKYREYGMRNKPTTYVLDMSQNANSISIVNEKLVSYVDGIPTTDTAAVTGTSIYLDDGYMKVNNPVSFNFAKSSDYAFSFWVNPNATQVHSTSEYVPLFNKNRIRELDVYDKRTSQYSTQLSEVSTSQFPFDISIGHSSQPVARKVRFAQGSSIQLASVTSSALTSAAWSHVICQKTGSAYQIWVNGTLDASSSMAISENTTNDYDFYIGSDGTGVSEFNGHLDELRIYNAALTSAEIDKLYSNLIASGHAYQTNRVGNIFYKHGIAVVSDPRTKYYSAFRGNTGNYDYSNLTNGFSGSFRSTTTFYEHEVTCKIRKNEYNFTQNPSIRKDGDPNNRFVDDYATGSYFDPYITTIGLYNDMYELVAIAKMASPLQKRDDVDINVIIRFDV